MAKAMSTIDSKHPFKGEGRVKVVNEKLGFIYCDKLDSQVFIIPSSVKDAQWRPLTEVLQIEDVVTFQAVPQIGHQSAKYVAVDGSVKLKKRLQHSAVEGDGFITKLDVARGLFGFLNHPEFGSAYFSVAAIRPKTDDVNKVFQEGKRVKFSAVPMEKSNSTAKWKATLVCLLSKSDEFFPKKPNVTIAPVAKQQSKDTNNNNTLNLNGAIPKRIRALSQTSSVSENEFLRDTSSPPNNKSAQHSPSLNKKLSQFLYRGISPANQSITENSSSSVSPMPIYANSMTSSSSGSPATFITANESFNLNESGNSKSRNFDTESPEQSPEKSSKLSVKPIKGHCKVNINENMEIAKSYAELADEILFLAHEMNAPEPCGFCFK